MSRLRIKARTWPVKGTLGVVVVAAGLLVAGTLGGVSPLGLASSGGTRALSAASVATSHTAASNYLVTFSHGTSSSTRAAAISAAGATLISSIVPLSTDTIKVPAGSKRDVLAALRANANVAGIALNRSRQSEGSLDPAYADQWDLPQIGWSQIYGSSKPRGSSKIAVLDTGVSRAGGDLRLGAGWSAFGTNPKRDPNGHGTGVASIAAAAAGNGIGVAGVDFAKTTILPVQVLNSNGLGLDSDIVKGVVWAADHHANVILMSFSNPGYSQALQRAVKYAWRKGAVVVAATGNGGSTVPTYPAGDAKVMGVAGTDQSDAPWSSSNTGADTFIAAPATSIPADARDGSETSVTGTSASAAMVAGAAALLFAKDRHATNAIVDGRLARSADAVGTTAQTGNGRLNLARAFADTSTKGVTPGGAPGGGPVVGPYVAAACTLTSITPNPFPTQSPNPVAVTGTAGYGTLTLNKATGSCSGSWSITWTGTTPAGATPTFGSPTFSGSGSTKTTTFSIATSATTVPGTYPFTVQAGGADTGGSVTSATGNLVVTAGPATHLSFGQQPTNTVAGLTITPAVTVRELDANNNVVTTDSSTKVTLAIGTNPSGGTLSGGGQTTVSSGVATFSGLSINKFGNGYTLAASDTTGGGGIHPLTSATSSTFNITARTSSTSVSCATNPVTYGGSTLCTATVSDSQGAGTSTTPSGTVAFASNGSGTFTSSGNCTLSSGSCAVTYTPTAVGTGTHQITATYTSSDSIHSGSSNNTNVTVNKASLTVTPDPQSRTYGQAAPSYTFSVTGFQNSENAGTASGYVAPSCTSDYTVTTTVAQSPRTISCSGGSADNYSFNNTATASLTVSKASLTVTPDPQSRTYGQVVPSYTFVVTGFQNGQNAGTASGYAAPSCTSDYTTVTTVAQSPRTISCSGGSADNYSFNNTATASLTVSKASLTVTPDPQSRTYGQVVPSYTFVVTGFQNGQNAGTASGYAAPSCTSDYTTATTVAQSPRTISCSGGSADNYSFNNGATANLTVGKASLTVTPDPQSRTYGQAAPSYTFSVTGFQNSENAGTASGYVAPSCTSDYTTTTAVAQSPRTISCSGGSADNYTFDNSATANLSIMTRALTVTASGQSKTYGTSLSLGTSAFTTSGNEANGEQVTSVTLTSTSGNDASTTAPVGTYTGDIVPSAATGSNGFLASNYDITYVNGDLSITNASFTMSSDVVIDGQPTVGTTLTITNAVFSPTASTRTQQWELCDSSGNSCSSIGGATSKTYTPVAGDVGSTLRIVQTVSRADYNDASSTSSATAIVINGDFTTTTAVAINGTPTVDTQATITAGSYSPTPTSSAYQWQLCDVSGNNCSDIGGATSNTYTPVASDAGSTLRVVETVSKTGYDDGSSTSDRATVTTASTVTNTPVAVNGTPTVGTPTTLTPGTYTPSPTGRSYQWQKCDNNGTPASCANISGATNSTYTPGAGAVGSTLRVIETVTKTGYSNGSSTSTASALVVNGNFATNTAVSVNGTPTVAAATTVTAGSYTPAPASSSYQWQLCDSSGTPASCGNIGGATSSTYTPVATDVGSTLRVVETVSKSGYNNGGSTSAASPVVVNASFTTTTAVSINGTPTQGTATTLTPGTYTPTPTGQSYQWRLCDSTGANCANIGGATNATYTPVSGDVGSTLRVVETVTKAGYNARSSTSSAVAIVGIFSTNTAVAIKGTPTVGTMSTMTGGTYTPSPTARSYQWMRCTSTTLASCANISGATNNAYTPVAGDVGKFLRVVETVTKASYVNGGSTSAASAAVVNGTFVMNTQVAVFGFPRQGTASTVTQGSYTPTPTSRTYQWMRCTSTTLASCTNISGATTNTYTPVAADVGKRLRVIETVSKAGFDNLSVTSQASAAVTT